MVYLVKVYRYDNGLDRALYDAFTFDTALGGASGPLGTEEEFEYFIEEVK